jgi:tetratricopeptide (TPR) repeat protein
VIFRRAAGDATPPFDLDGVAADPDARLRLADPLERLHVASVLDLLGRSEGALRLARGALAERPGFPPALYVISALERRAGLVDEAAAHADELVRAVPGWAQARVVSGQALLAKGDSRGAARRFEEALALEPQDPIAATSLLAAQLDAGDLVELRRSLAQPSLRSAVPPEMLDFYLARAAERDGDLDRAEAGLRAALAARASFQAGRLWLGIVLFERGSRLPEGSPARGPALAEARASFEAILAASPRDGEAWLHLGTVLYYEGSTDAAIEAWVRARDLRPRDTKPCTFLARAYLDLGKATLAAESARAALARDPKNVSARALLEDALRRGG